LLPLKRWTKPSGFTFSANAGFKVQSFKGSKVQRSKVQVGKVKGFRAHRSGLPPVSIERSIFEETFCYKPKFLIVRITAETLNLIIRKLLVTIYEA
jgi:hypothetical protein